MRTPTSLLAVQLLAWAPLLAQAPASGNPVTPNDPRVVSIVRAVSARELENDIRVLVSFGTRHTGSDTLSPTRGIGAARRWIHAQFDSMSAACGGCLEVTYVAETFGPTNRQPVPVSVVSVVAVQKGQTDTNRVVVISGHFDSRNSDAANITDSAPGADDDGSGTAAVIESARVLSRQRFAGTVIYAALAGEEEGLWGGQAVARWVHARGYRVEGVLNNDIVGNTHGADGANDDRTLRVFSDGTPPTETEQERLRRRSTGGEVDGISRQVARYVHMIARQYVTGLDVWMIYRLDRYGRGGDHRAFADLGYPAVRITEAHEDWSRQHQNVRMENGTAFGDVIEGVDFPYLAKVTSLNAASLASLAFAPAPPRTVRITGGNRPAATITWQAPEDSSDVTGYRVYWRRTDSPTWDNWRDVGMANTYTATGLVIDNWFFGVAAVSRDGHESTVVFPGPAAPGN
ncbi:MAG: M28 family metallopeptidase [Gemmatimonadales bacterium]